MGRQYESSKKIFLNETFWVSQLVKFVKNVIHLYKYKHTKLCGCFIQDVWYVSWYDIMYVSEESKKDATDLIFFTYHVRLSLSMLISKDDSCESEHRILNRSRVV